MRDMEKLLLNTMGAVALAKFLMLLEGQVRSKPRVETHGHERPLNHFVDVAYV